MNENYEIESPNISEAELYDLATKWMLIYGVNINLERAIPLLTDGLKPVWRKILYAIYKNYRDKEVKVSTAVGDVSKLYPHSELGMKDIFARLSQPFTNNTPLLIAHGNNGTATVGKNAAHARYWGVSMSKFAIDVLFDEFDGLVNMKPNYDNTLLEPVVLPSKFPLILLNGSAGIGYTLSSDVYPYNLSEVADATIKLLKNPDAKIKLIPDSPTGCDIIIRDEKTFVMQSSFEVDNINYIITIKNTPYMRFLVDIHKKLCEIQESNNPIKEIKDANDESDLITGEIKYVISCEPCNLYNIINELFKRVPGFRITISTSNMKVVDNYQTKEYDVRQILRAWIRNRLEDKRKWLSRELVSKTTDRNMLDGKAFMLSPENLNKTIGIFRSCHQRSEIIPALVEAYDGKVTTSQANYISDVKLYHLTDGEYKKTLIEIDNISEVIDKIHDILENPEKICETIIDEIKTIKNKYGEPRRSKIINTNKNEVNNIGVVQILADGSVLFSETENPEHLSSDITAITGEDVCLVDDHGDSIWINTNKVGHDKPMTLTSIGKNQMGKCVAAVSNLSNDIILLTNQGRIKYMPINKIPSNASRKMLIPLNPDEIIVSSLEINQSNADDILIYTTDGYGKRLSVSDLTKVTSPEAQGQFIIKDKETAGMFLLNSNKPLLVYITRLGRLRVNQLKFLTLGKKYTEPKPIIKLSSQDDLISVFCAKPNQSITLNHVDGRITTVNVSSLPVVTMSAEPQRPKHVPGVKVLRATLVH